MPYVSFLEILITLIVHLEIDFAILLSMLVYHNLLLFLSFVKIKPAIRFSELVHWPPQDPLIGIFFLELFFTAFFKVLYL